MKIPFYQVDAFSSGPFTGNPAAICPLDDWLDDYLLQQIAEENNLSETAFLVSKNGKHHLRWFSPKKEVRLCGHATLATSHICFTELGIKGKISFETLSGTLSVERDDNNGYNMLFPLDEVKAVYIEDGFEKLGFDYVSVFEGTDDYLFILKEESDILKARPDFAFLKKLKKRGVIISAESKAYDFVSRCFYPAYGVDEDPATGSAHTLLSAYWSKKLSKQKLKARQLSKRGANIHCHVKGDKVVLNGNAITIIKGTIYL